MEDFNRHESQLFQENEIKNEPDSDTYSDAGSLILDCVKEEEQLQGQQESPPETLMCSKCSFKTKNKDYFKAHMNQMHLNKYKCDHCPKRFSSEAHFANHMREKHEDSRPILPEDEFFRIVNQDKRKKRLYECLKCVLKTDRRPYIYIHIRSVHRKLLLELYKSKGMVLDDAGYHKCTKCFYKTLQSTNLKHHIKTVHQKRLEFVCDFCDKAFSAKENLTRHMKFMHISSKSLKLYKCSICTYKTIDRYHLKSHLNLVHLKIRRFKCDLCQMEISTKNCLQWHIEKHHLRKNSLSCNRGGNCSFRTTENQELLRHIRRVHEKIQGFSCEICGKWYSSPGGLYYHMKEQDHVTK